MIKSLLLLTLFTFSSMACDIYLKIETARDVDMSFSSSLSSKAEIYLKKRGYYLEASSQNVLKLFLSKANDGIFSKAKSSLKLFKSSNLENYTQGYGRAYKKARRAYTLKNFRKAIVNSISHLPRCPKTL